MKSVYPIEDYFRYKIQDRQPDNNLFLNTQTEASSPPYLKLMPCKLVMSEGEAITTGFKLAL